MGKEDKPTLREIIREGTAQELEREAKWQAEGVAAAVGCAVQGQTRRIDYSWAGYGDDGCGEGLDTHSVRPLADCTVSIPAFSEDEPSRDLPLQQALGVLAWLCEKACEGEADRYLDTQNNEGGLRRLTLTQDDGGAWQVQSQIDHRAFGEAESILPEGPADADMLSAARTLIEASAAQQQERWPDDEDPIPDAVEYNLVVGTIGKAPRAGLTHWLNRCEDAVSESLDENLDDYNYGLYWPELKDIEPTAADLRQVAAKQAFLDICRTRLSNVPLNLCDKVEVRVNVAKGTLHGVRFESVLEPQAVLTLPVRAPALQRAKQQAAAGLGAPVKGRAAGGPGMAP